MSKQNYYAFSVRLENGTKTQGGCVHANTMDEAGRIAILMCELTHEISGWFIRHDRLKDKQNRTVYLSISVHPEYMTNIPINDVRKPPRDSNECYCSLCTEY